MLPAVDNGEPYDYCCHNAKYFYKRSQGSNITKHHLTSTSRRCIWVLCLLGTCLCLLFDKSSYLAYQYASQQEQGRPHGACPHVDVYWHLKWFKSVF